MNLKKYASYITTLLFFYGCHSSDNNAYKLEEEKKYYTQNSYKLDTIKFFEKTITIPESCDDVTKFKTKLTNRGPKWSIAGTEKKPYDIWSNFFNEDIVPNIVNKLAEKHDTTLLENYYDKFGELFRESTKKNEEEVSDSLKKLRANKTLVQAFKKCIAEKYHQPETIYLSQPRLEYQEFFYFIFNEFGKDNKQHINLKKLKANLEQWKKDGHPSGAELWQKIQQEEKTSLQKSKIYQYKENQQAITQSLRLINQLMHHLYSLTYKDLLETLPHGKKKLKDILHEVLENKEKKNIKLLRTYLRLVSDCL